MHNLNWLFKTLNDFVNLKPHTSKALERLNINKPVDLLFYLPRKFKKRHIVNEPIKQLLHEEICITLEVIEINYQRTLRISTKNPFKIISQTKKGEIVKIVFFNPLPPFLINKFQSGNQISVIGKLEYNYGIWQITHPNLLLEKNINEIEIIYPLTYALTNSQLASIITNVVQNLPKIPEWLPETVLKKYGWQDFSESIKTIHLPKPISQEERLKSIDRIAFDEMLAYFLALKIGKLDNKKVYNIAKHFEQKYANKAIEILGFELTEGQTNAVKEINDKLQNEKQAHILLQGDVGSGKTLVALISALNIIEAGFQAAIMVPTTILAIQHYEFILKIADKLGINLALLISKTKAKDKRKILAELKSGSLNLIIGTQALLTEEVEFANLALAIIDEQHRFGVEQRLQLIQKGNNPDLIAMSATPIPRTLAQTLYSDMQIISMYGKPKNRKEIITSIHKAENIEHLLQSLERPIRENKQIYWVCPLIDNEEKENKDNSKISVLERYESLNKLFPEKISYVHGKLKEEEKANIIEEFKKEQKQVLVATTVIEVGVNIPNATIIVIESAENYGLAQLHQLRGRVGRGDQQSYCILVYERLSKTGIQRLKMMKETNDGFELAEADLKLRGGGDIVGTRQSGWLQFKIADYEQHYNLLKDASNLANTIMENDPYLIEYPEYRLLLKIFEYDHTLKYISA